MKTFSYSQQQLLDVLRITPLQANANFLRDTVVETSAEALTTSDDAILQAPNLAVALAQDIQLALPDGINWQIDTQSDKVELNDKLLVTPAFEKLQHAQSKKTLWRLLSNLHED
ncbi:MAG TPA: hypothetical protein VLA40_02850 [Rheinheimera sp.]|nr:hypothetical protein [Rheinheimera sp.]